MILMPSVLIARKEQSCVKIKFDQLTLVDNLYIERHYKFLYYFWFQLWCCMCKWFRPYISNKCKNKYSYMVLHGQNNVNVRQIHKYIYMVLCNYVKQCKKMIFLLGGGGPNGPWEKKPSKHLCFRMHHNYLI
jgi:hypothetical protein